MSSISFKVLKVIQPIGEFYIGSIKSNDLLACSKTDVRRFHDEDPETIDGIQRELSKTRVNDLKSYVNLDYATFPTSVILAIEERCVNLEKCDRCPGLYNFEIRPYEGNEDDQSIRLEDAAFVIDGQHRLAGLRNLEKNRNFDINVSIFVGADKADQAEIFSRVNLAQTKVNKSLAYDLFDYAREKSPVKVAHDLVIALNNDINGPFHHRIKRLGVVTPGLSNETLAQATVVNGLLRHLPIHQEKERSKSLINLSWKKEKNESWKDRIFVDFYRKDDFTSIFLNISNFFDAVSEKWPDAWKNPKEGQILARTTGYYALIRFLKDVFVKIVSDNEPHIIAKEEYAEIFKKISIQEKDLIKDKYVPGSSGQTDLYRDLKNGSGL